MTPPTLTIVDQLRREHPALGAYDVKHLWLFGSVARGEPAPGDVDVMVEFNRPPGLVNFMELKFRLEQLLGLPVDLVSQSACRERFRQAIAKDLVLVA